MFEFDTGETTFRFTGAKLNLEVDTVSKGGKSKERYIMRIGVRSFSKPLMVSFGSKSERDAAVSALTDHIIGKAYNRLAEKIAQ